MILLAGMRRVSFDIAIDNDNIVEGNEDFTLVITSSSPPVGNIGETMVTIVDDECKYLYCYLKKMNTHQ